RRTRRRAGWPVRLHSKDPTVARCPASSLRACCCTPWPRVPPCRGTTRHLRAPHLHDVEFDLDAAWLLPGNTVSETHVGAHDPHPPRSRLQKIHGFEVGPAGADVRIDPRILRPGVQVLAGHRDVAAAHAGGR